MLVRLLYASRAVDTTADAIESILHQSRDHNPISGVTGVLCYGGGIFLQAIEGGRMAISELYGHIQRDKRHAAGGRRLRPSQGSEGNQHRVRPPRQAHAQAARRIEDHHCQSRCV